jgi:hypothetical protein
MKLSPDDSVSYQGQEYRVDGVLRYDLGDRQVQLALITRGDEVRFLEPLASDVADRMLVLTAIDKLDIDGTSPKTIYHRGESYILQFAGTAKVTVTGRAPGYATDTCTVARYRAAGGLFLQIEYWPQGPRMLAGASVHKGMLEVRPATRRT